MEVSLVEAADQLAGAYGPEVAEIIEDHMKEKGVDCLFTGDAIEAFLGDEEGRVRRLLPLAQFRGGRPVPLDAPGLEPIDSTGLIGRLR